MNDLLLAPAESDAAARPKLQAVLARWLRDKPIVQLALLAAMFAYGAATLDGFGSASSIRSIFLLSAFLGLAALGQTIVVLVGHLDLSLPGFIGFGNMVTAILYGQEHWGFPETMLVVVPASALLGGLSGLICHRLRVQSIVVTLGMNFVMLGFIGVLSTNGITGTGPAWLTRFATLSTKTFGVGVPPLVVLWFVVAILAGFVLRGTLAGRRVYFTGSNPRAAELALVPTGRVVVAAFALSAVSATLTGVLLLGFSGSGYVEIGSPYMFTSLIAVIVGGTLFGSARGDYWRTVIGALMFTVINTVLLGKGYSNAQQQILFGVIVLIAVLAYGRESRLRDRI